MAAKNGVSRWGWIWVKGTTKKGAEDIWDWEGETRMCVAEKFMTYTSRKYVNHITKSRKFKWSRSVSCLRMKRNLYMNLMEKREGKKQRWRPRHRWDDIIKLDFKIYDRKVRPGLIWLRIQTSGGLLWAPKWTSGFYEMQVICLLAEVNTRFVKHFLDPLGGFRKTKMFVIYSSDNIRQEDDKWRSIINKDIMMLDMRRIEVLNTWDILAILQVEVLCVCVCVIFMAKVKTSFLGVFPFLLIILYHHRHHEHITCFEIWTARWLQRPTGIHKTVELKYDNVTIPKQYIFHCRNHQTH